MIVDKRMWLIIESLILLVFLLMYFGGDNLSNLISSIITGNVGSGYGGDSDESSDVPSSSNSLDEEVTENLNNDVEGRVRTDLNTFNEEFDYYLIEMLYNEGKFSIRDWSLEKGNYPSGQDNKEFKIKLYSTDGVELFSNSFANPGMVFSDGITGGVMEIKDINFYVIIPNIAGSEKFKIKNRNGRIVFEMEISKLSS